MAALFCRSLPPIFYNLIWFTSPLVGILAGKFNSFNNASFIVCFAFLQARPVLHTQTCTDLTPPLSSSSTLVLIRESVDLIHLVSSGSTHNRLAQQSAPHMYVFLVRCTLIAADVGGAAVLPRRGLPYKIPCLRTRYVRCVWESWRDHICPRVQHAYVFHWNPGSALE